MKLNTNGDALKKATNSNSLLKSHLSITRKISYILSSILKIGNFFHQIQINKTITPYDITLEQKLITIFTKENLYLLFGGHKELTYHENYYKELTKYIENYSDTTKNREYHNISHNTALELLGVTKHFNNKESDKALESLGDKLDKLLHLIKSRPTFKDYDHQILLEKLMPAGVTLDTNYMYRSSLDNYVMCLGFSHLMQLLHGQHKLSAYCEHLTSTLKSCLIQLEDSPLKIDHIIDTNILLMVFPVYILLLDQIYSEHKEPKKFQTPSYRSDTHQLLLEQLFLCRYEYPNNQGLVFGWGNSDTLTHMNICHVAGNNFGIESLPLPGSVHLVNEIINKALLSISANAAGMIKTELNHFTSLHHIYTGSIMDIDINLMHQKNNKYNYPTYKNMKTIDLIHEMHMQQTSRPHKKIPIVDKLNHIKDLMSKDTPIIDYMYHPATKTDLEGEYGFKNESIEPTINKAFIKFLYHNSNMSILDNFFIISDTGYCLEAALLLQKHKKKIGEKIPLVISSQLALNNPDKLLPWRTNKTSQQKRTKDTTGTLISLLKLLYYYPFSNKKKHHTSLILHGSTGATIGYNLNDYSISKEETGQFGNPNFPNLDGTYASTFLLTKELLRKKE